MKKRLALFALPVAGAVLLAYVVPFWFFQRGHIRPGILSNGSEWQLFTGRRSTSNISLVSLGRFGSFGIDIGPANFVELRPDEHCEQVYAGLFAQQAAWS